MANGPGEDHPWVSIRYVFRCEDRSDPVYRGKTLGGGTSINGGAWTRGLNAQYDAWSKLLEDSEASVGWNWDGMFSYMKKVRSLARNLDIWLCIESAPQAETFLRLMRSSKRRVPPLLHRTMAQPDQCK